MTSSPLLTALETAVEAARRVPIGADAARACSDDHLMAVVRLGGELAKIGDAIAAVTAGEVARRSDPVLGLRGLAQRQGHRTTEELLKKELGLPGRDAAVAVRVGRMTQPEISDGGSAFAPLGDAVASGAINVAHAEAIRSGLGDPTPAVAASVLADAATALCQEARELDPDRLRARAAELRDEIDAAGVADREANRRAKRSFQRIALPDGMRKYIWVADPETACVVDDVYDRITSPRRGGPRFVGAEELARAEKIERDPRTTEQLASDGFTELLRQAATVDESVLLGGRPPAVRVIVAAEHLEQGAGHGVVEGSQTTVSMATVERLACAQGTQQVLVDSLGQVLDLGREQRYYTASQRLALAIRDGGCRWPGCERPPSWCEAHHIRQWARDNGCTDLADGILLCRYHHLRLHNEGWEVTRDGPSYLLHPPPGRRAPVTELPTKSRAIREHVERARVKRLARTPELA